MEKRMNRRLYVRRHMMEEYYVDVDDATEKDAREIAVDGTPDPIYLSREEKFEIIRMLPVDLPEDREVVEVPK